MGNVRTVKSYFLSEGVSKLVQSEKDGLSAYKDLVERGELTCWKSGDLGWWQLQVVQNFDILGVEGLFLFCTLLKVLKQGISSSVSLALIIVDSEVVVKEFLGPADLFGAQTLRLHKLTEVVVVGEYEHLMLRPF